VSDDIRTPANRIATVVWPFLVVLFWVGVACAVGMAGCEIERRRIVWQVTR